MSPSSSLTSLLASLLLISTSLAAAEAITTSNKGRATIPEPHTYIGKRSPSVKRWNATPLTYEIVGNSGVSAQMMFLGTPEKMYILDKTENNPLTITQADGTTRPAWGVEYDISTNTARPMDVESNTFCAGGMTLGNGTWAVFGGNQPVTTGGVASTSAGAYDDTDGGTAIRLLNPSSDGTAEYIQGEQPYSNSGSADTGNYLQMTGRRWYPWIEPLQDGSLIVIGGDKNGGYVNTAAQDNPTYEFFPPKGNGNAVSLPWLSECLPVNLYPLTFLLPSGNLFMQANWSTILYNWESQTTTQLPFMTHAVRVYPASAGSAMLPLTPANNYTATLLFCGGSAPPAWGNDGGSGYNVTAVAADNSCVRISPDSANPAYEDDDFLDRGRSMGTFNYLPDGTLWYGNGVAMGTAGYGDEIWSVGQSYGQAPIYTPALYNPNAPAGSRWTFNLAPSTQERMYHSTVVLLTDGSLMISGSNPNKDYTTSQWPTKYSVERWYPSWYNKERPVLADFPSSIAYGGSYFNLTLGNTTDESTAQNSKVVLIRGGFSTHALSMGQRYVELATTYFVDTQAGVTTLFVSQLPPNPAVLAPGPAMLFLVVNGIPSEGQFVMIGNGQIGQQPTSAATSLPSSSVYVAPVPSSTSASSTATAAATGNASNSKTSAAFSSAGLSTLGLLLSLLGVAGGLMVLA